MMSYCLPAACSWPFLHAKYTKGCALHQGLGHIQPLTVPQLRCRDSTLEMTPPYQADGDDFAHTEMPRWPTGDKLHRVMCPVPMGRGANPPSLHQQLLLQEHP